MSHNCPTPASRDRNADLQVLSAAVVTDLLRSTGLLTHHTMDTPDLLVAYVERCLGVSTRVNWMDLTDEELPAVRAWQDYCTVLFDSVHNFVRERVLA